MAWDESEIHPRAWILYSESIPSASQIKDTDIRDDYINHALSAASTISIFSMRYFTRILVDKSFLGRHRIPLFRLTGSRSENDVLDSTTLKI
jgi:hypothetical protein